MKISIKSIRLRMFEKIRNTRSTWTLNLSYELLSNRSHIFMFKAQVVACFLWLQQVKHFELKDTPLFKKYLNKVSTPVLRALHASLWWAQSDLWHSALQYHSRKHPLKHNPRKDGGGRGGHLAIMIYTCIVLLLLS